MTSIKYEMESNFDNLKNRTNYHFDAYKNDPAFDTMRYVGKFIGDWDKEINDAINTSKEMSWLNLDTKTTLQDIKDGAYDRKKMDPKKVITNMEYNLAPIFHQMADALSLNQKEIRRLHVQFPGQVWNLHLDRLEKYNPEDPTLVRRFMVMLTDYQPGHFVQYGNYVHTGYHAGEIYTFDWWNTPHCTANAGLVPRCILLVTGVCSDKTKELLAGFNNTIKLD